MALEKLYLEGTPGQTSVQDARLAYVEVMLVTREGKMAVETSSTPVGKEFYHDMAAGIIQFDATLPIQVREAENNETTRYAFTAELIYVEFKS